MTDESSSDALKKHIYERMNEKDTDELVAIWQDHNPDEWTPEAFDVIKAILIERLGELPGEDQEDEAEDEDDEEDEYEDGFERVIIEYPSDKKLLRISDFSHWLSWAALLIGCVNALGNLIDFWPNLIHIPNFFNLVIALLSVMNGFVYPFFIFVVLQAISEVIYLLMDLREMVQPQTLETETSPE